jgi:stearoyl-CoA desaturase (delta-9 desaturase)
VKKVETPVVAFMAVVHVGAAALGVRCFSWAGVAVCAVLYLCTGFGVTVGYHRLLTHRSFAAGRTTYRLLAVLGLLSGEGPPIFWVAQHRKHHALSDREGDPHRPADGFWWAHWLWTMARIERRRLGLLYSRYAPDLARDPFCLWLEKTYFRWHLGLALLLAGAGAVVGGGPMSASFVGYGFFVRTVCVLHATWLVNSVTHLYGSRPCETRDESRNNALVALVSLGEGWHNNHHHAPTAANHGHRAWQVDPSFLVIVVAGALSSLLRAASGGRLCPVHDVKVFRPGAGMQTLFRRDYRRPYASA